MSTKQETFEQLLELQHLMSAAHHQRMMQHGPMADATRGKGRVLALLKMKDGLATKDMANVLGIRVSSLNETLGRLEAAGYVERRQSPEDGRVMLVYLTDKGRGEEQPQSDLPSVLFEGFEEAELDTLQDYLGRMSNSVETHLGPDWREQMRHMRHHREQIFHQATDPHCPPFGEEGQRGPNGFGRRGGHGHHGSGPSDEHEQHGFGGGRPQRADARYARQAEDEARGETCDHNCRSCTRETCVRTGFPRF